ncbi:MAG: nitrate/nitrite transporter NrtS [Acidimicrobiales bacterium]
MAPTRPHPGSEDPAAGAPSWSSWREAVAVMVYRPHLRKTVTIALVVGTVLFCINQLDVVLRGDATTLVWVKGAITYLVPFGVSNAGVLVASRVEDRSS